MSVTSEKGAGSRNVQDRTYFLTELRKYNIFYKKNNRYSKRN